ncbi:hypothetical protein [Flagellimonas flava]|uniref:hypothetical protein n=1 Tax=Flagellimonas flava TaxID=570519 RepID=UPI003D647075
MPANGALTGKELLTDVQEEIKQSNERLKEFLATYVQLKKEASKFTTTSGGNKIVKQRAELDGKVNSELKERTRLLKALERQEAKNNQVTSKTSVELAKQRLEAQRANRANKENAILTSRFSTAYEKLSVKLTKARRRLKDLVLTQGENAVATRKASVEVQNLDRRLKGADAISGQFGRTVGNYPTALKPAIGVLRQLVGVFGLLEGVRIALDITKESLALAREAKGIEFAFRRLGDVGVKAFSDVKKATRGLLSDLDIQRSLVELDNFNISLDQAGILFEFLTVRATQTGQSIDKLKDSLVEGLSKESLLRIDNLGISTSDLNSELEKTPNFVEAVANVAKREVAEAGSIIDEAANSQERFNASIENTKKSFGQLLQSNGLGFFGALSTRIDKIDTGIKAFTASLGAVRRGLDNFIAPIRQLLERFPTLNKFIKDTIDFIGDFFEAITTPGITVFAQALTQLGAVLSGLGSAFVAVKDEAINFIRTLARFGDIDFSLNPIENFKNIKTFFTNAKDEFVLGGKNIAQAFSEGYNKALNFEPPKIEGIEDIRKTTNETGDTLEDLTPQVKKVANVFEEEFEKAKNIFKAFKKTLDFSSENVITAPSTDQINAALNDISKGFDKVKEEAELSAEELKGIYNGLFSTFASYYNLDLEAFEKLLVGKTASFDDYADLSKSIGGAILESSLIRFENEIVANQERLNAILNDDRATEEQKAAAQKKFDEEQKKIRTKQAKAERNAVLIQIGIDTAAAVAKVLAQTGIVAPAVIPTIVALGLAQAAFVASQPLPQFFKGKKATDSFEGLATWGERRREVLVDKQGNITVSPNKTTPLYVRKDDIIVPSMSTFDKQLKDPESDVSQRLARRLDTDTKERVKFIQTQSASIDTQGIEKVMERVMMKYANRPVNATIKLEQPDNYTQY